ncbi:MAG: NAD(+)/NADH kinase [Candidatus Sumerlaeia bacterium]
MSSNNLSAPSPEPSSNHHLERLVIYANPAKAGVGDVVQRLGRWASGRGLGICLTEDLAPLSADWPRKPEIYPCANHTPSPLRPAGSELLVCLGGDGTLLHGARRFWPLHAPVLAVNLGSLSFNATVDVERVVEAIEEWEAGRAKISERMALKVRMLRDGAVTRETAVLNDVVLSKQIDARLIHVELRQGGELVSGFAADGLIVATPTGSTAYNLSAGGPIVMPTLKVMVVTAICPHTLAARPVVLPPHPAVQMQFMPHHGRKQAVVWLDGQEEWPLDPDDRIDIEADPLSLKLVMLESFQYFSRLRQKLSWSGKLGDTPGPEK